jgi:hypothetical protein
VCCDDMVEITTTQQFNAAYKRSLLQRDLTAPVTGNCTALDETIGITGITKEKQYNFMPILLAHQQEKVFEDEAFENEELEAELGTIQKDVTTYIGGALVRSVQRKISCETCRKSLFGDECNPCPLRWSKHQTFRIEASSHRS